MVTPFDKDYNDLQPTGKYILVEVVQEKAEEKKLASGIIVPVAQRAQSMPQFALVRKVGSKVEIEVSEGDFVEVNAQLYPNIVDKEGYGKYQLLHEEQITGVYKKNK